MKKIILSLVLPCYNEAEHFLVSAETILTTLKQSRIPFEIIFVEDKSTDETWQLVQQFAKKHPQESIQSIQHKTNLGRGKTVTDGILIAKGEIVGFIDIDCEISPNYIRAFVSKIIAGWDVVCGHRLYQTSLSGILRAASSKTYAAMVRILLSTRLSDTEAGYKFFNKAKVLPILTQIKDMGWFWDTEVMVRSERAGFKISFIPVKFERRTDKSSTVNLWSDTVKYLKNLWRFRQELRHEIINKKEVDKYWYEQSAAFSHQYNTILGFPLTPVGLFLVKRLKIIREILSRLPGKTFLDVGCGSGVFLREAILQGRNAIGLDYSKQMLSMARNNLKSLANSQYKLIQGNATKISLKSASIDVLLASGLTDYLTSNGTKKFMKEVSRLLKSNGTAILTFPKSDSPFRLVRKGFGLVFRKHFLQLPSLVTTYSRNEIEELLSSNKLRSLEWKEVLGTMRIVVARKY